jgi:signal transduction histidine kinase
VRTESGVALERRHFDLWPMVEALIHDLRPVAGTASTQLINQIPLELSVYADAALVRRIMQNLIANAIRYTPRGEVTLGARALKQGSVEIQVSDNGSGIAEERLPHLFDAEGDSRTNEKPGLGLTIVRTFVEAHGGSVRVESRLGEGSTFRFTLPGLSDIS